MARTAPGVLLTRFFDEPSVNCQFDEAWDVAYVQTLHELSPVGFHGSWA